MLDLSRLTCQLVAEPNALRADHRPPRIRFARLDFDSGASALLNSKHPVYRSEYVDLRWAMADAIRPSPSPPFPPSTSAASRDGTTPHKEPFATVRFGIMTSKVRVSTFAVERNRARTRFKAVVADILKNEDGAGLIDPGSFLLHLVRNELWRPRMDS
jgi:hypothetical protein